jgi:esterase/lipase superfamily enzyme
MRSPSAGVRGWKSLPLTLAQRSLAVAAAGASALNRGRSRGAYQIRFMAPPAFLEAGDVTPFSDPSLVEAGADPRIPYVTLRAPAKAECGERYYASTRAGDLRLGIARIALGRSDITWNEARRMSILKNRSDRYPLQVAEVLEFGLLDRSVRPMVTGHVPDDPRPRERFTAMINDRLERSQDRDIFIYVHGYRVNFENPLLVAAELWHFLGYEGVFIPFAWPARTHRLDYFGDTESTHYSAPYLRDFIAYLASETRAEAIHIIGYSAGTRLVAATLYELALLGRRRPIEEIRCDLRLGNVILVASDIDRGIFINYLHDGLLRVPGRLTIYESPRDRALRMARRVLGGERVGQLEPLDLTPAASLFLHETDRLVLVDVESVEGFDVGNGHGYFRDSPLVSSDLLATLRYDMGPSQRGLARIGDSPIWTFPGDYLRRLEAAVVAADPELARRARALEARLE